MTPNSLVQKNSVFPQHFLTPFLCAVLLSNGYVPLSFFSSFCSFWFLESKKFVCEGNNKNGSEKKSVVVDRMVRRSKVQKFVRMCVCVRETDDGLHWGCSIVVRCVNTMSPSPMRIVEAAPFTFRAQ